MAKQFQRQSSYSNHSPSEKDFEVMKQLEDMKDQTAYMKQFRAALGSALDEVKTLRSELAQEKSKGFEILKVSHRPKPIIQNCLKQQTSLSEASPTSSATNEKLLNGKRNYTPAHGDVSQIIAESETRLNHIRDAISRRTGLIHDLKKKLQLSTSTLNRRETKLETKINKEKTLKNEVLKLTLERDDLKNVLAQKTDLLQKENDLVRLKDKEIKDLLSKMSDLENNLNNMYRRMSDRDRELSEARHQLQSYSTCPDCPWMRDYIRRLEYQLEHYRYSQSASSYRYPSTYSSSDHRQSNRWFDSPSHRRSNSLSSNDRLNLAPFNSRSDYPPHSQYQPGVYKPKHTQEQKRLQAAHRQRIQEFRNASLVLSPISEDSEEAAANTPESNKDAKILENPVLSHHIAQKAPMVENQRASYQSHNPKNQNIYAFEQTQYNTAPKTGVSQNSCHYFTVQTEAADPSKSKNENCPMAYLQLLSRDQNAVPNTSLQQNSNKENVLKKSEPTTKPVTDCMKGDGPSSYSPTPRLTSTATRPCETSLLHRLALSNANSSPDLTAQNKTFSTTRSYPSLSASVASSGSIISTESGASDTTGCSSDSGLAYQVDKKRVRSKRYKRSGRNSKYITFRDHKIDVTRFSTSEFRETMWSLCADPNAANEFLTFLSAHAKRLENDPQWSGKHSLGTPEEWLALKGSY